MKLTWYKQNAGESSSKAVYYFLIIYISLEVVSTKIASTMYLQQRTNEFRANKLTLNF